MENEIETNEKKAFQWYLKSAKGGNIHGQFNFGAHYFYGPGYLKSAEGGYHKVQFALEYETKAFQWYLKSAEGGYNKGQYNLGRCYQLEIGPIKESISVALHWYLISAEGGNSYAQTLLRNYHDSLKTTENEEKTVNKLDYCYLLGIGTIKDDEKAFQ
ncbi:hypothetical protein Glove_21g91 [Diversispora epigaea]|uniref:Uncharacterized protein n=1 Tax=Diversispora epigaea TaxID=1348612 RepID=A0A397JJV3_9GLOM|nr:hypothetical protein Glove_21g91 [Diversispora epigaea]